MTPTQQEEGFAQSEPRLRLIFDNAGVGITEIDADDSILMINNRQCEITGRSREELIGRDSRMLWHPEDEPRCLRLQADLRSGRIQSFTDERRYLRPDGEIVWVRVNAKRLPAAEGVPTRRIAIVEDITEKKIAERKLQESEEALRMSNERLETKIAERTHELEENVQSLREENALRLKIEKELREQASQLRALASELTLAEQRERRRLAQILHDHLQQLLVSAKIQISCLEDQENYSNIPLVAEVTKTLSDAVTVTRSLSAELSPPVLHEEGLVPGLLWLARWMESKYGIKVALTFPELVPTVAEDISILLFESVRELLFNIIKHANVLNASVAVESEGTSLSILVSDNGLGFDPSTLKHAGEGRGGFGLFSIKERIRSVDGELVIKSAPGKGALFTITVNLKSGVETNTRKIRLLIVDDHTIMREGLARLLGQETDIEIVGQASNGLDAAAMAEMILPDVILMDISMPRLNGVEATQLIHQKHPKIQIIGLSMYDDNKIAEEMRHAGATCFISKDGPVCDLKRVIRDCVHRSILIETA